MFQVNEKMGKWLETRLRQITENWWDELVLNNLSKLQIENILSNNL